MIKPAFSRLDAHYNTNPARTHACTMPFAETSAIRMCEALAAADPRFLEEFRKSTRTKCPHGFIRGAGDLAELLSQPHLLGAANYTWPAQKDDRPPTNIYGKRGIICFNDIPEYNVQGHIDLWDDTSIIGNEYWDAKEILMWELI